MAKSGVASRVTTTSILTDDIKQLSLVPAILSLSYIFWVLGAMEMVERLAFYGVKAVATLYAKDPVSKGGLGITMTSFGNILMIWALVQSILPVFTGGLSDRYGYKQTIFLSTLIKISGYLVMAWFPSYNGFFAGAVLLATGTAIFKPGIQGTLIQVTTRQNSSMAWGIFYQTVNVGGFLGPLVAGLMRKMAWSNVFYACASIICLNFLLLLVYKEPEKTASVAVEAEESLWRLSLRELSKPQLWLYLTIFSGFWFMFNALFDVLPAHIQDWVDTRAVVDVFANVKDSAIAGFFLVLSPDGTQILPEGVLNINAGLIMTTCFLFAFFSGRFRATTSMVIGTTLSSMAFLLIGVSAAPWLCIAGILVFSMGEMLSSPKFSEYLGNIAPSDKRAMYMGFSQIPLAIGWTLEGKLGPMLYDFFASKDRFSRDLLAERGMSQIKIDAIPQGEAFEQLVNFTGENVHVLTRLLYDSHSVGYMWYVMALVGFVTALGIVAYGRWIRRALS